MVWYKTIWQFLRKNRVAFLIISAVGGMLLLTIPMSKLNIGIRHALPVLPFVAIVLSLTITQLSRPFRITLAVATVLPVLVWLPNLLSYTNILVTPSTNAYKLFRDSNLDWNQQLYQVASILQEEYPGKKFALGDDKKTLGLSQLGLAALGIDVQSHMAGQPLTADYLILSASALTSPAFSEYSVKTPVRTISNTTFIYSVRPE